MRRLTIGDCLDLAPELTRIGNFVKFDKPEENDFAFIFSQCGKDIIKVLSVAEGVPVEKLREEGDFGVIFALITSFINENYSFFLGASIYTMQLKLWLTPAKPGAQSQPVPEEAVSEVISSKSDSIVP